MYHVDKSKEVLTLFNKNSYTQFRGHETSRAKIQGDKNLQKSRTTIADKML